MFTRIWLALCGEWAWDDLPAMPLELMLLPPRRRSASTGSASWARATIVPLLILMDERPGAAGARDGEPGGAARSARRPIAPRDAIDRVFLALDRLLHHYHRLPWHPLRARAPQGRRAWIVAHQEADGSWGGIQPPWVYSLMALHALGYGPTTR